MYGEEQHPMNSDSGSPSPLFLFSSERSGTNLLRRRLNEWQSTAFGPSPAHFLKHLFYHEPYYGDLLRDRAFRALTENALKLCYTHFSPWDVKFEVDEVLERYEMKFGKRRNTILLSALLMTEYAKAKGYSTFICKDNNLFDYAHQIAACMPESKFIYLHRDPRDYTLSQLKRSLMTSNPYRIAELWRNEQIKCISILCSDWFEGRILRIPYEKFIQDELKGIREICAFANLKMNERRRTEGLHDAGMPEEWENLDKPTMKYNFGKFKHEMSRKQIKIVESIVWHQMLFLGYTPQAATRPQLNPYGKILARGIYLFLDHMKRRGLRKQERFELQFKRSKLLKELSSRLY